MFGLNRSREKPLGIGLDVGASHHVALSEYKVGAVILALPEPLASLALVDGHTKISNRIGAISPDETAFVSEPGQVRKHIFDPGLSKVSALAFENKKRRMLPQNPLGAFENS